METKKLYDEYMITSMVPGFEPVEVESAEGTRVHCTSGKTYLDCFSGISVVNAGHRHPKVIAAAKEQLERNRRLSKRNARGNRYLLRGLTVCAKCGYAFYGKSVSKGQGQKYLYYRCDFGICFF